jgi:hypothetical protein
MTTIEQALSLLEDLDPNVHACMCSGCTEAVDKYNELLALLRKIQQEHEWSEQ